MTVQELIARLQELPPDAIAMVRDDEGDLARVDEVSMIDWRDGKERAYISGTY